MPDNLEIREELVYAAISSNRSPNNISCNGDLLLYSGCFSPIIYNLRSKIVAAILHSGHTQEVNGQSFVQNFTSTEVDTHQDKINVISTSHDQTAIIWQVELDAEMSKSVQHEILHVIESPDESVFTTRSSFRTTDGQFISILTTMHGSVCVFQNERMIQKIQGNSVYLDAKVHFVTYSDQDHKDSRLNFHLVALGGSDNLLRVFYLNNENELTLLQELSGFNNWITSIDFLTLPSRQNEILLATACQDSLIRVWQLKLTQMYVDETTQHRTKFSKLGSTGINLTSTLETVLSGHEGFVQSLCWFKMSCTSKSNLLQLVSCSADKTLMIWRSSIAKEEEKASEASRDNSTLSDSSAPSPNDKFKHHPASEGVWQILTQFGETGETNLPFLSVCLSSDELTIYGHSLNGAIHSWSQSGNSNSNSWSSRETICGHFDHVTDLAWDKTGAYLLSSSLDKTCRLHTIAANDNRWHELARPQVHGYEINCLASMNFFEFASGAEEKTIRTFGVTKFFIRNYKALARASLPDFYDEEFETKLFDETPEHAQLPALGLSNRGSQYPFDINEDDNETTNHKQSGDSVNGKPNLSDNNSWQEVGDLVHYLTQVDRLDSLPFEEILLSSTLWWEKNKLFGHCNELYALDCDSSGSFLASASKATRSDVANVIVWETNKYRKVATIEHHSLTVTRIRFSPDDKYLLSVSRDRTWCLSERNSSGQLRNAYEKLIGTVKSNAVHERIIWDCCWTYDSKYFMTVSRDKRAILWSVDDLKSQIDRPVSTSNLGEQLRALNLNYATSELFDCSVQAVDSARAQVDVNSDSPSYLFVLGFEDGSIELSSVKLYRHSAQGQWQSLKRIRTLHQLSVRRLAFQPLQRRGENKGANSETPSSLLLASGGNDCMVRLTRFHLQA